MNIAILDGNVISNVIVVPDKTDPADFGGVALPEGMWIGDKVGPDPEPEVSEVDQLKAQVADLQNQILTMRLGGI